MKRHLLPGIGLMVGLGLLALRVAAQEQAGETGKEAGSIPCPVDQVLRETREQNARRGKTPPESFYSGLAQNYVEQCQQAKKSIADLLPKLAEYEAGKRGDRDGYIILQRLLNNYEVIKATGNPVERSIREKRDAVAKKNPDFPNMQKFKLSEELPAKTKRQIDRARLAEEAKRWTPPDNRALDAIISGKKLVAWYQYHIDFYNLPTEMALDRLPFGELVLTQKNPDNTTTRSDLNHLTMAKSLTFRRRLQTPIRHAQGSKGHFFLACTYGSELGSSYSPMHPEEEKMTRAGGGRNWINKTGQHEDFCGVITSDGSIQFQFPIRQLDPGTLLAPVGVSADGKAAVAVGEEVVEGTDDGDNKTTGNFREVLRWEFPNKMKKIRIEPKSKFITPLQQRFEAGEF